MRLIATRFGTVSHRLFENSLSFIWIFLICLNPVPVQKKPITFTISQIFFIPTQSQGKKADSASLRFWLFSWVSEVLSPAKEQLLQELAYSFQAILDYIVSFSPFCMACSLHILDARSIEEEAERKIGWLLKLIFAGTATIVAYQFMPYMGDNVMRQSVSLLQVKDPLFKRMGASRLARFAVDDERRMKIVEMGAIPELLSMLETAKDDLTQKEALRALDAISKSEDAVWELRRAGAVSVIRSTPDYAEDDEIIKYKSSLLNRFEN